VNSLPKTVCYPTASRKFCPPRSEIWLWVRIISIRVKIVRMAVEVNGFCSLAVFDPRVGHTMGVLSPFISVLCRSD